MKCKGVTTAGQPRPKCAHNPTDISGTDIADYDYDVVLDPSSTTTCPACLYAVGGQYTKEALPPNAPFLPYTHGLPGADKETYKRAWREATGNEMPHGRAPRGAAAPQQHVLTYAAAGLNGLRRTHVSDLGYCFYLSAASMLDLPSISSVLEDVESFCTDVLAADEGEFRGSSGDASTHRDNARRLQNQLERVSPYVMRDEGTADEFKFLPRYHGGNESLGLWGGGPGWYSYVAARLPDGQCLVVLREIEGKVDTDDCWHHSKHQHETIPHGLKLRYDAEACEWHVGKKGRRARKRARRDTTVAVVDSHSPRTRLLVWTGDHYEPATV